jgi:hypothetical protein
MGGAKRGAAGSPVGIARLAAADTVGAATVATTGAGDCCEAAGFEISTCVGADVEVAAVAGAVIRA